MIKTDNNEPKFCECGCEAPTKGGRFLPGHDAKLKKQLIADALAGGKRAEKKLEALGWTKFLEAKREKVETKKAAKQKRRSIEDESEPIAEETPNESPAPVRRRGGRRPKSDPSEASAESLEVGATTAELE
ncbi:MAG: hypothetical protein QM796_10900 [Chthoniobacteraceae bacterium]